MKKLFIILFIVLVLGFGGYLLYSKLNYKGQQTIESEENRELSPIKKYIESSIDKKSWGYESLCLNDDNEKVYGLVTISIPQFRIETDVTKKLNEEILLNYKEQIDIINGAVADENSIGISNSNIISYKYNIDGSYVWLLIKNEYSSPCMNTNFTYNSYLYDKDKDITINFIDMLKMYKISNLDVIDKFLELNSLSNTELQILLYDIETGENFAFYKEDKVLTIIYNKFNTPNISMEI